MAKYSHYSLFTDIFNHSILVTMANIRNQQVDKTFLSLETAERRGFLHRDYIAHCFRWTHVIKRMMERKQYEGAKILDVGAGKEIPFATTLYSSRMIPSHFVAVDAGKFKPDVVANLKSGKLSEHVDFHPETLITDLSDDFFGEGYFTHMVMFEVAEHMEPGMLKQTLKKMARWLDRRTGRLFLSTPCWDVVSCAANHVNEMRFEALGAMLEDQGWQIANVHGTFASQREYRPVMNEAYREVFEDLKDYYDSNVLATIFAPMFPAYARNCLWELRLPSLEGSIYERMFNPLDNLHESFNPWGSSDDWETMRVTNDDMIAL